MAGTLRNRKKSANGKKAKENKKNNATSAPPNPQTDNATEEAEPESLFDTFRQHLLVKISPLLLIPYCVYTSYYYIRLKRPDLVSNFSMGMLSIRPAVTLEQERQVLILGSIAPGHQDEASRTARSLSKKLGLEIGVDAADATNYFVRDGTVASSWFQTLRFLEHPSDSEVMVEAWKNLCWNWTLGFHPRFLKPSECARSEWWSQCWARECMELVHSNWGCALNSTCVPSFRKVLYQARHPLRTTEELVNTHCSEDDQTLKDDTLVRVATTLFPSVDFDSSAPCVETVAKFVLQHHRTLLAASAAGYVDQTYRVEKSSACDVARLAGFLDEDLLYTPHRERILALCNVDTLQGPNAANEDIMDEDAKKKSDSWDNANSLGWEDMGSLENEMKELAQQLGYMTNDDGRAREADEF